MKMAPILRAFRANNSSVPCLLVHAGQHYDRDMSDRLFEDLRLPRPDINLEVGSATHAVQTAEVTRCFEPVLDVHHRCPPCFMCSGGRRCHFYARLYLGCGQEEHSCGAYRGGLRSFDRAMPEEINRVLTDQVADLLYTTEAGARDNLAREGVLGERVRFVGNVMIDLLLFNRRVVRAPRQTLAAAGFDPRVLDDANGYGVVTLYRPSNVDQAAMLQPLREVSQRLPLVFAMHPRTRGNVENAIVYRRRAHRGAAAAGLPGNAWPHGRGTPCSDGFRRAPGRSDGLGRSAREHGAADYGHSRNEFFGGART